MTEPQPIYKAIIIENGVVRPGLDMTDAWLDYLMRERQTLIIKLGQLEDVLIEHGRIEGRSIIPRRKRY